MLDVLDLYFREYETEAIELLNKCSSVDKLTSGKLVDTSLPQYGKKTLIELAALSERMEFVSNNRCKRQIDKRWRQRIIIQEGDWLNFWVSYSNCKRRVGLYEA